MTALQIAAYAAGALGPTDIAANLDATRRAGWTTIILGLFHIGYPPDQVEAEIFFNSTSIIEGGKDAGKLGTGFDRLAAKDRRAEREQPDNPHPRSVRRRPTGRRLHHHQADLRGERQLL
jgi:hypothetical protein